MRTVACGVMLVLAACSGSSSGGGGGPRVYQEVARLSMAGQVTGLAGLPSQGLLAVGLNGAVQVRASGMVRSSPSVAAGYIQALGFSPDGSRLYTGGQNNGLAAWDTATGASQTTLTDAVFPVRAVAVNAQGLVAAAFGDNTIRTFGSTGTETGRWLQQAMALAFVDESTILTAGADGVVRRFAATGAAQGQFTAHVTGVAAMSHWQGHVATAGFDGTVRVSSPMGAEESVNTITGTITAVAYAQDGTLAAGTQEGEVVVFVSSGPQRVSVGSPVTTLAGGVQGRVWAGTQDGNLIAVDLPPLGD